MMKRIGFITHNFLLATAPAERIALLRIATGCFSLWYLLDRYKMLKNIFATDLSFYNPVGIMKFFNVPLNPSLGTVLLLVTIVLNFLYIIGWRFKWTGPMFALLLLIFFCYRNSWSMIYHNYNLLVLHVMVIGFASSSDALSADSAGKKNNIGNGKIDWRYGWPIKLICVITVITYVLSGVAKISGDLSWDWLSGDSMRSQLAVDALRKELFAIPVSDIFKWLYFHNWIFLTIGILTLLIELCAPLFMLNKRMIAVWIFLAFITHWGVFFIMGISFFYHMTGIVFLSFLKPEKWLNFIKRKFAGNYNVYRL